MHRTQLTRCHPRGNVRLIVRQKPIFRSWSEKFHAYMRPSYEQGLELADTFQLLKFLSYLIIPLVVLQWWRYVFPSYPQEWEDRFSPIVRPVREPPQEGSTTSYFDVMESLEAKREAAIAKKITEQKKTI